MTESNSQDGKKLDTKGKMRQYLDERGKEARIIRKIVFIITLIITIVLVSTLVGGYVYINSALQPMDANNTKQKEVVIPIGSSSSSIGKLLEEEGIIKNSTIFKYYVKFNNISGFQAGNYHFSQSMTLEEISSALQTGKLSANAFFKITIPEGYQLEQIAEAIAKKTTFSEKEIIEKLNDEDTINTFLSKYPEMLTKEIKAENIKYPLEGYLFPATYSFYEKEPTLESIIDVMLAQTDKMLAKYQAEREEAKMTVHELLTMASLIEKEATDKTDRSKIASVFYNRLEANMELQTDPTIAYALGEHIERTMYDDLKVDSPYNTYKNKGLTPSPIANAGLSSIEAALHPAETDYYYFLAAYGTGEVYYSKTLDEHNALKKKYITDKRNEVAEE